MQSNFSSICFVRKALDEKNNKPQNKLIIKQKKGREERGQRKPAFCNGTDTGPLTKVGRSRPVKVLKRRRRKRGGGGGGGGKGGEGG